MLSVGDAFVRSDLHSGAQGLEHEIRALKITLEVAWSQEEPPFGAYGDAYKHSCTFKAFGSINITKNCILLSL